MTTIATAEPAFGVSPDTDSGADRMPILEIADSLEAAASAFHELERDGVMSPYGRYDWIAAYLASVPEEGRTVRVVLARDGAGRPLLAMPVSIERRLGLRVATAIGGKHVNFCVPTLRPDIAAGLTPARARALLRKAGQALGVDAFALPHVPVLWNGGPNPFAIDGQPSPSDAWSIGLEPDGEATLARSMSGDARKKLRNKSRGLAKLGPVDVTQARDEAGVDLILEAFFRQKEERFKVLGITDPFAGPGMKTFLRAGALSGLADGNPPIELYGLTVGGRVIAVLGGAGDTRRLSGMFVSFEDGEAARFSPGEILVTTIIRMQCERGRKVFDLGVGDARYKRTTCDTRESLVEVTLPVTLRGRLYGAAHGAAIDTKRRIKANPRAMALVSGTRRLLASLRR